MDGFKCFQCKRETRKFADYLSCNHSVCPKCLANIFVKNSFDTVNHIIPSQSSDKFKYVCICQKGTNQINLSFYLSVLKDLIITKTPLQCKNHPAIQGTVFCSFCDIWNCDSCFMESECRFHLNPGELTNKCQEHDFEALNIHCNECKIAICKVCKENEHKSHKVEHYSAEDWQKKIRLLPYKTYKELEKHIDSLYNSAYTQYRSILKSKIRFYDDLIEKIEKYKYDYLKEMQSKMDKMSHIVNIIKITYENLYLDSQCDLEQLLKIKKYMNNAFYNISINPENDIEMDVINSKLNLYLPANYTFQYSFQFKLLKYKCKLTSTLSNKITTMVSTKNSAIAFGTGNTIQIYNIRTKEWSDYELAHKDLVTCLLLLNNDTLASGSNDKTVKLWNLNTSKEISTLYGHKSAVKALCTMNPEFIASCGIEGVIKVWNYLTFTEEMSISDPERESMFCIVYLSNGTLASGGDSETIKIWDYRSIGEETVLYGHLNRITCLIELKDCRLASASLDKSIKIWKNHICVMTLEGHSHGVLLIYQLYDERIASGSADKTARIWNLTKGETDNELTGHSDSVTSVIQINWEKPNKNKDNMVILSGSLDNSFKMWE